MSDLKKKKPVSFIFSHLSEEERIDKACEFLAIGVLRFAEREGLISVEKREVFPKDQNEKIKPLHQTKYSKEEKVKTEATL